MSSDTKVDPWALLREARECVVGRCNTGLLDRIDAALAAHEAEERVELPEAEQDGDGWRIDQRERYEGTTLCAVWKANGRWYWQAISQGAVTEKLGHAETLNEAKAAAIAAARGMR